LSGIVIAECRSKNLIDLERRHSSDLPAAGALRPS
jgi:hypothetical protein